MPTYTCITCDVIFATTALQQEHYKMDWHRYNLIRKVAGLPPVTDETFSQNCFKEDYASYCEVCRKYFGKENPLHNHLGSWEHLVMVTSDKWKTETMIERENQKNSEKVKMSTHTCISCHVMFSTTVLQREHYKTDWHRYNLMRKVAELPPVTNETFLQKAAAQRDEQESVQEEYASYCEVCRKYFGTKNTFQNHLQSKKHLEMEEKEKSKTESVIERKNRKNLEKASESKTAEDSGAVEKEEDDDDWVSADEDGDAIPVTQCLFCAHDSDTMDTNVDHMTQSHSFFLPDIEYLTDLEGLLTYLGEKVGIGNMCLWCSQKGRSFHSTHAVQQHMLDKGHSKMLHEGETLLEYSNYYDYSKSYPSEDKADENAEGGGDEEIDLQILETDDWQLVLPSGAMIGHRSLAHYYRQNVPPNRPATSQKLVHRLMHQYRALGWTGTTGEVAVRKARDIKYMHKMQAKQALKLGLKANKFQPHFRPQVMF